MLVTLLGIVTLVRLVQYIERLVPDAGDAVGDRVASGFAPRILDECGLALVEQDAIHTAIDGVECIHRYRCQAGAATRTPRPRCW